MENVEDKVLQEAAQSNFQIKKLYTQHRELDKKIEDLCNRTYLTEEEQVLAKQLKREKLRGKDRLSRLIAEYQSLSV